MNELTQKIKTVLHPCAALIAYRSKNEFNNDSNYFLELRQIGENGKMGEAMPVTYEFMNELAANYSEAHSGTPFGAIPSDLLYADIRKGHELYVWYNPPRRRMMFFRKCLGIENAEYNVPGIIYVATEETLYVYAFKGDKPTKTDELYAAPYFNVTHANVCLGSSKLTKPSNPSYAELLEYWEKRFWLTEFTHLGGGGNPTKSNLVLVTKAAHDKPFDLNELKPLKTTLKNLIK